jgi:hypothetical protein
MSPATRFRTPSTYGRPGEEASPDVRLDELGRRVVSAPDEPVVLRTAADVARIAVADADGDPHDYEGAFFNVGTDTDATIAWDSVPGSCPVSTCETTEVVEAQLVTVTLPELVLDVSGELTDQA